eukprot:PhM_4_TR8079/c0_g1_i1/m.49567/K14079/PAPD4, GLD2; poly(A) RNA polymerase GLD2
MQSPTIDVQFTSFYNSLLNDPLGRGAAVERFLDLFNKVTHKVVHKAAARLFGSRASGLHTAASDADVVVCWSNCVELPTDQPEVYSRAMKILDKARHALIHLPGCTKVRLVPSKHTPIVTCVFEDILNVDVTVQPFAFNQIRNTDYLRCLTITPDEMTGGRFVQATVILKEWARCRGLLSCQKGLLSSYMIAVMVLHVARVSKQALDQSGLSCFLLEFFRYFSSDFNSSTVVVTGKDRTYSDGDSPRDALQCTHGTLCVEDLTNGENCARRVGPDQWQTILVEMENSCTDLSEMMMMVPSGPLQMTVSTFICTEHYHANKKEDGETCKKRRIN